MWESIISGASTAFTLDALLWNLFGVVIGIVFGCLPGLTATMGVAVFTPMTFGMPPVPALAMLLGIYCGGMYGGSISAVLIKTPGTPSAAATVLDGYPLTEKGQSNKALSMSALASFTGGIFSCAVLIMLAPQLARAALKFGPPEYFAVAMFGLSIVSSLSSGVVIKGIMAGILGVLFSMIGMDPVTGNTRFTFGRVELLNGIPDVPALIGIFAISEVLLKLEKGQTQMKIEKVTGAIVNLKEYLGCLGVLIKSAIIGTIVGIIPATGGGVASWFAYGEAKRGSKHPERFGTGILEGVAASESANNAVTGGALVPLLTLGVPGDVVTAVLLGALMIQGLTPGPTLFVEKPEVVGGIFASLMVANVFMVILGLAGARGFSYVLRVPEQLLMPFVTVLCLVGSYAINNSLFDVFLAVSLGVLGYGMTKLGFPLPPLLLGLILGPMAESNFRRSLTMSHGDPMIFVTRPISLVLLILAVGMALWPALARVLSNRGARREAKADPHAG